MWVRIVEIHSSDAFSADEKLIGKRISDKYLEDSPRYGHGYKHGRYHQYYFLAVKVMPDKEWHQLKKDHILASVGKFDAPREPIDDELRKDHMAESFR